MIDTRRLRAQARAWMQRVTGPEPQPIRLPQSRVYVLPSRAGAAMLATLAIMLVASINYNLALGFALVFLLSGVGLAHILQSWRTLVGLEIFVRGDGEVFVGEAASFVMRLTDTTGRLRPGLTVLTHDGQRLATCNVPARGNAEVSIGIPAQARGWLPVGKLTIESRQPLGWIRAWSYIQPDAQMLAYPRAEGPLPQPPSPHGVLESGLVTERGDEDFAGLRNRNPQDSASRIAWKRMASSGELLVKEFSGAVAPERVIDWSSLPTNWDAERRLSQLALWVVQAQADGARWQLVLPKEDIGPDSGEVHARECLAALALFLPDGRA
ncbi:DUF58 domain-containing protein [Uliginosibacterium sp. sgz301328]|uniref:DUF58 domain-containing protein n=1 Tax=Uliginosibacterium sp. sgz301328 TaxID=3243764 RepID=UPI00359CBCDB